MSNPSLTQFAFHYTARLGFALVPIPKGQKRPVTQNWQHNPITDPQVARKVFAKPQNMGLLHSVSRTCTIDVDNIEYLKMAAAALDIDLMGLIDRAPLKIKGKNGEKPLYRLPDGLELPFHKLVWPHESERLANGRQRTVTVIEFRAGEGKQDVLPPSIHPDTQQPYRWVGKPPRCREDIPEIPADLLSFWMNLDTHIATMKAACPWAEKEVAPTFVSTRETPFTGESAIDAFNAKYTPEMILQRNGYKQRGGRWISPNSSTKMAGVTLYNENGKTYAVSYHGSDEWADGHGKDAFNLFMTLECRNDFQAALSLAREEFGIQKFTLPTPEKPSYTVQDAVENWAQHHEDVLTQAAEYIGRSPVHHHAKEALIYLTTYIYQAAGEGNLSGNGSSFALMLGGIRNIAAIVGGKAADCKARLEWLADNGLIGGLRRVDAANPNSGLIIDLPGTPLELPFLSTHQGPTSPVGRPQTKAVRDGKKQNNDHYPTHGNKSRAYAVGRVKCKNEKNPLRALLQLVLCLRRNKNIELKSISKQMGKRLTTVRRQFAELQELGYLTVEGRLTCSLDQYLQDMRAGGAELARKRLINTLERQREYAVRQLSLIVFGVAPRGSQKRYLKMRDRCEEQLTRLYDGESPHAVIGRAA